MDWLREYHILMAHFAQLNFKNVVDQVVVVNNDDAPDEASGIAFLNSLFGDGTWVQTSYNGNIRKNYAGIGYTYDLGRDAFIAPQPYPSWVLNENTCLWDSPVPMPTDGLYDWDESTTSWIKQNI
jgi:hypothetical protein